MKKNQSYWLRSLVTISFIFFSFCATAQEQKVDQVAKLKWLDSANPVLDAKKAIKKGDYRLRAIFGYAVKVPGIDQGKYEDYKKIYGFNPIEGTSDALVSSEHVRLQHLASEYALKYNKVILNN